MELSKDKWRLEIEILRNSLKKLRNIFTLDSIFSFDTSNIAQFRINVIEFDNVLKTIPKSAKCG
jgi:hypothetical protein